MYSVRIPSHKSSIEHIIKRMKERLREEIKAEDNKKKAKK
jgi:hypothetical protein|tara:strand:- start:12381 stop:12500 length:120 start_codon:yes stop_codon:yes gene_type:complete